MGFVTLSMGYVFFSLFHQISQFDLGVFHANQTFMCLDQHVN